MHPEIGLTSLKPLIPYNLAKTLVIEAPSKKMITHIRDMCDMAKHLAPLAKGPKLTLAMISTPRFTPFTAVTIATIRCAPITRTIGTGLTAD